MMEQQKEQKWHLVRNNNGEWVCSEQVVYLDNFSTMVCNLQAKKDELPLSPQTDYVGETRSYKHEIETKEARNKADPQELK